jgi:hypothetical protein
MFVGVVILFTALVFGLGADNDLFRSYDFRQIFTYQKAYYRTALLGGRLPLWTPHTFGGWPFAANPLTQTFYPPSLVMLLLPQPAAIAVDLVVHLSLAAIGAYLLLRRSFALRRGPASFGALVYPLSGPFVSHVDAGHVPFYEASAYAPWLLLALDRSVAAERALPWIRRGGVLLGLQILTGGIPYVWLTLLLAALLRTGTVLCQSPRDARRWVREATTLATVVTVGVGLAAVQLLPTYELTQLSNRAHPDWEYAAEGSFPPGRLPLLVFPRLELAGDEFLWEYYGYVGAVPVTLALTSLLLVRRDPRLLVIWTLSCVALLFAVGRYGSLYPFLWHHVPGFTSFRVPARAVMVLVLTVSLAAALALDALVTRVTRRRWGTAIVLAVNAITFVDVTLAARWNRDRLFMGYAGAPADPRLVDTLRRDGSWYRYWFSGGVFRENHAYAVGARSVGGYDNLILDRYRRFVHYMTDTPLSTRITTLDPRVFADASAPFPFKVLGVKYATYRQQLWIHPGPEPIRRAWFVTRERRVADEREALAYMRSDRFRPYDEVVFEATSAPPALSAGGEPASAAPGVVVTEVSPEHLRIDVGPHGRGFLVLSEIFYPGWHARANGRELPIYRADSILRCVPLEPTDRRVEMVFAPQSLRWGVVFSAVTAATLLASRLLSARR